MTAKSFFHPDRFPIATAFRKAIAHYHVSTFRHDLMAAFVVSLIALPLSMALSIAVGLPPQHGIYTAIVAGFLVPLLGGSMYQVTGPTAAFVVILAPIVAEHGLRGIIWAGLLAGIILMILGFSRLGRLIRYVPYPVTTGFTAGIGLVLATLSLNDFLGLGLVSLPHRYFEKVTQLAAALPQLDIYECSIGSLTLLCVIYAGRWIRVVPSAVIAMVLGTLLGVYWQSIGIPIDTIGSRFAPGIPAIAPILHWPTTISGSLFTYPSFTELKILLLPALAIAMLSALESLLSATVADSMTGTKHDPNAELTGLGIGTIFSALAMGIPATGAIARTAANINSGAKTPLSVSLHAILILLYVLLFSKALNHVPMSALAALLIYTAYRMSHLHQFMQVLLVAPRSDVIVMLTCFVLTVFIDMVAGIGVGMVCAAFLLMQHVMEMTHIEIAADTDHKSKKYTLPPDTILYRIYGPLFFGTVEKAFDRAMLDTGRIKTVILDIEQVPFIDMSGLVALNSMLDNLFKTRQAIWIVCHHTKVLRHIKNNIRSDYIKQHVRFFATLDEAMTELKETNKL